VGRVKDSVGMPLTVRPVGVAVRRVELLTVRVFGWKRVRTEIRTVWACAAGRRRHTPRAKAQTLLGQSERPKETSG
jgi:hypothetical protein